MPDAIALAGVAADHVEIAKTEYCLRCAGEDCLLEAGAHALAGECVAAAARPLENCIARTMSRRL